MKRRFSDDLYGKSGIYIINTGHGVYIGKAKSIGKRWELHISSFRRWQGHDNSLLQRDYELYGLDSFSFRVLEETDNLIERESYWINEYRKQGNCYNGVGRYMHSLLVRRGLPPEQYKSSLKSNR